MDPRDRPSSFADGVECAVCGRLVPLERIRLLARRDDLSFVEVACGGCRSESLGIVVDGDTIAGADRPPAGSGAAWGEFLPADERRFRGAPPIGPDDVATVTRLLATGRLAAFVGGTGDEPPSGPGR